jgi:outer membrane protein assembly factor BamB
MLSTSSAKNDRRSRWWPAIGITALALLAVVYVWTADLPSRQKRIELTAETSIIAFLLIIIWLLFFSRLRWKVRLSSFGMVILMLGSIPALFRVHGISGDILPILEWRWAKNDLAALPASSSSGTDTVSVKMSTASSIPPQAGSPPQSVAVHPEPVLKKTETTSAALSRDYPQFLGPHRDAKVQGIKLSRDWSKYPPRLIWRQSIGAGWSAFAVANSLAITQEQRGRTRWWWLTICAPAK